MKSRKIKTDPIFSNRRLVEIYDDFDPIRDDLEPYIKMLASFGSKDVIDFGCGTGCLALMLAQKGYKNIVAVDPAKSSIDFAKLKPGAGKINWVVGGINVLKQNSADAIVMTGNVAQAISQPALWLETLNGANGALRPGGYLIFETRNIKDRAWEHWNKSESFSVVETKKHGRVEGWVEMLKINLPLVSFRWSYFFHDSKTTITSDSTLRFRTVEEVKSDLVKSGFVVDEIREAPDRLGKEHVFIARKKLG